MPVPDPRGLTVDEVHRLFRYEPETGLVYWRVRRSNVVKLDKPVGCPNGRGYLQVRVNGRLYQVHNVIWVLQHGHWPEKEVDHRNRSKGDNRDGNLKQSTRREQLLNRATCGKHGFKGVARGKFGRFRAYVLIAGKAKHLGMFDTAYKAALAFDDVAAQHGILTNRDLGLV